MSADGKKVNVRMRCYEEVSQLMVLLPVDFAGSFMTGIERMDCTEGRRRDPSLTLAGEAGNFNCAWILEGVFCLTDPSFGRNVYSIQR